MQTQPIIDQFTRQAIPFSEKMEHADPRAFKLILSLSGANANDTILDVACGPGLVALAFAGVAKHVMGIDLTPAMIERARHLQKEKGLANLIWQIGDAAALPFTNESFSLVVTRYSFHHFPEPAHVLGEMARVCTQHGRIIVVDVALPPDKIVAYDQFEKLRDPSHCHALTQYELEDMMTSAGLQNLRSSSYRLEMELEDQLRASFPNPGDADRLRQLVRADIGHDALGLAARHGGDMIYISYPTVILIGTKP